MAEFKINPTASLTEAETERLQKTFASLNDQIEKAKVLEQHAKDYFKALEVIGEEAAELHKYTADFTVDGREIWVDRDNYYSAARAVNRFWIPSSMSC